MVIELKARSRGQAAICGYPMRLPRIEPARQAVSARWGDAGQCGRPEAGVAATAGRPVANDTHSPLPFWG